MKTRIISGLGIMVLALIIIYLGGITMYVTGAILSMIALREFYKAVGGKLTLQNYVSMVFAVLAFILTYNKNTELLFVCAALFMLCNFIYLIKYHQEIELKDFFANVFGFIYIVPAFLVMAIIRDRNFGALLLLMVFVSASATDTFAYFVGKAIGKHKLAPKLSPNKTIEGSIGGTLISTILFVVAVLLINHYGYLASNSPEELLFVIDTPTIIVITVIGLFMSILSQLGDLSASAIKRITGVKDYGHLIPGHGGILDRMDSALFTAPAIYVVLYILVY